MAGNATSPWEGLDPGQVWESSKHRCRNALNQDCSTEHQPCQVATYCLGDLTTATGPKSWVVSVVSNNIFANGVEDNISHISFSRSYSRTQACSKTHWIHWDFLHWHQSGQIQPIKSCSKTATIWNYFWVTVVRDIMKICWLVLVGKHTVLAGSGRDQMLSGLETTLSCP